MKLSMMLAGEIVPFEVGPMTNPFLNSVVPKIFFPTMADQWQMALGNTLTT
jgi:hypothetical protein